MIGFLILCQSLLVNWPYPLLCSLNYLCLDELSKRIEHLCFLSKHTHNDTIQ